ncbi:helix-turn-helix transcriptional regulator [Vibrio sp. HN007]|uniref:AraC family transcriptional regulator n=1 Tax=Vibrio iocasae TaxID=3098914 RepID=UPI0035D44E9F
MRNSYLIGSFVVFLGTLLAIYTATHLDENSVLVFTVTLVAINFVGSVIFAKKSIDINRNLETRIKNRELQFVKQRESLSEYNNQLRKKLTVRSIYTNNIVQQAKQLSEQPIESSLSPELLKIKSQLRVSFDSILALESDFCDENGYVKVDLVSLVNAVIDAWRAEFKEVGVDVRLMMETDDLFIKAKCVNIDDLLNQLITHIYNCSYVSQEIDVRIRQNNGRLVVCFVDSNWQIRQSEVNTTSFGSLNSTQFIQKMVEDSGGRYQLISNDLSNEIVVSWSLWNSTESLDDDEAQDKWLRKVMKLIDERYHEPEFSTSSASKCLFLSERSLQRKFKSLTQQTFTEYLTQVRLKNACGLLKNGHKVCDVAMNTGFNDPSYFSQKFRNHYGVSPSKYCFQSGSEMQGMS